MEINGYDIHISPARAIKGQVVVEFVLELTLITESLVGDTWTLHVDGSSDRFGKGAGVVA